MEDKYHDLIIGYLQSRLTRKEMDSFYSWVNENDENKKLYFETKAIYDACKSSAGRKTIDINESWQRLLLKNKKRKFLGVEFQRFGSYVAVAFFAGLIALSVNYILNPHTGKFTAKYVGGDGIMADKVELPDGTIVTGKTGPLLGAAASALLNALKRLAGIDQELDLVSAHAIEPIQTLKTQYLGSRNPRLHTDEILIALSSSVTENAAAAAAMHQLPMLKGCDVHSTVILSSVDADTLKKLGMNLTCDPVYEETGRKYHKI